MNIDLWNTCHFEVEKQASCFLYVLGLRLRMLDQVTELLYTFERYDTFGKMLYSTGIELLMLSPNLSRV